MKNNKKQAKKKVKSSKKGSKLNTYSVALYTSVLARIPGIKARSQAAATQKAANIFVKEIEDIRKAVNHHLPSTSVKYIELVEDGIDEFLVDVVGDEDFSRSKRFDGQYKETGPGTTTEKGELARDLAVTLSELLAKFSVALSLDENGKDPDGFGYDVFYKAKELLVKSEEQFPSLVKRKAEPVKSDVYHALQNLMRDLMDSEDNRNPETGEEYGSCAAAREVLDKYYPNWLDEPNCGSSTATTDSVADKIKSYIKGGGMHCPICGSRKLDSVTGDTDAHYTTFHVTCNGCGSTWDDIYNLTDIANLLNNRNSKQMGNKSS